MSGLNVVAEVTAGLIGTVPHGSGPHPPPSGPFLVVSVTDADGQPVHKLTDKNFKVHVFKGGTYTIQPPAFADAAIHHCDENLPGVYILAFQPMIDPLIDGQKNIYAV